MSPTVPSGSDQLPSFFAPSLLSSDRVRGATTLHLPRRPLPGRCGVIAMWGEVIANCKMDIANWQSQVG
ncbi:MAG TPA: hypothetical protein DDX19_10615 [Rhodopirellula baltica]|uniref:Uncharacterized protein n=1 Tax=Rhodopirellula baltica SWK14 TaxID=993516 RepID=L7CGC8_RHOBT|nr:hypothetical protein RBSWK_02806 [Rhodopirellula baltica SWK14]HBE63172.1 hypothetical protein [Rhodopirellula baltica]